MIFAAIPDISGNTIDQFEMEWSDIADYLVSTGTRAVNKHHLPLFKLAKFGTVRTPRGSLRHDANILECYGVEGDYDGELVSPELASMGLSLAGITHLIYTSPSHTVDRPRWRVVCPTTRPFALSERATLLGRVNAALGGILASESFTGSQTYYFGHVDGMTFESYRFDGACVDDVQGLAPVIPERVERVAVEPVAVEPVVLDELRSALGSLDPDMSYPQWQRIGQALKSLGDAGFELFDTWSSGGQKYNKSEVARKWSQLGGQYISYKTVLHEASAAGWINPRAGVRRDLGTVGFGGSIAAALLAIPDVMQLARQAGAHAAAGTITEAERAEIDAEILRRCGGNTALYGKTLVAFETGRNEKPVAVGWQAELEAHVDEWNKKNIATLVGQKHFIMRHDNHDGYVFVKDRDMELIYMNTSIKVGEEVDTRGQVKEKFATHYKAWVKHPRCVVYTNGVVFRPGDLLGPETGYYNLWQGFKYPPCVSSRGDITRRIREHIYHIVCDGNDVLYTYLMCWIAYTFQHPGRVAGVAVVMRGLKGSGKGTLGHLLVNIWGRHGLQINSANHLVGNFNAHLAECCLLFADEAFYGGDVAHENRLKGLITEPSLQIERKGVDMITQPNYLKIIMATNADYAVPATGDERRFCVLDVSPKRIGDREYFNELHKDIDDPEVLGVFLNEMLHMDLSGFNINAAPDSVGLRSQRAHSFNSIQEWLANALTQGSFDAENPFGGEPVWPIDMSSAKLYAKYIEYCTMMKKTTWHIKNQNVWGKYMSTVFNRHRVGSVRKYHLGTLDEAIAAFERIEKVKLDELS